MTTKEAFEIMKQKFPNRRVKAFNWFDTGRKGNEEEVQSVNVDDQSFHGENFQACIERACKEVKTTAQLAESIRAQARELLQQAVDIERSDRKAEVTEDAAVLKQDMIEDPHCHVLSGGVE